ncbi:unnamed protein product [Lactuca virosa]|uniref:Uncharacterized protein n=1 Tax=Lactuca virosa TaxID=75947 RepID=A0AAU9PK82_9ASTR|nr:unnamed protein product [Lactuca virosa]
MAYEVMRDDQRVPSSSAIITLSAIPHPPPSSAPLTHTPHSQLLSCWKFLKSHLNSTIPTTIRFKVKQRNGALAILKPIGCRSVVRNSG